MSSRDCVSNSRRMSDRDYVSCNFAGLLALLFEDQAPRSPPRKTLPRNSLSPMATCSGRSSPDIAIVRSDQGSSIHCETMYEETTLLVSTLGLSNSEVRSPNSRLESARGTQLRMWS